MWGLVIWIMLVMWIRLHSFNSKETIHFALISSHRRSSCLCVSLEKSKLHGIYLRIMQIHVYVERVLMVDI